MGDQERTLVRQGSLPAVLAAEGGVREAIEVDKVSGVFVGKVVGVCAAVSVGGTGVAVGIAA